MTAHAGAYSDLHDELRSVARDLLGATGDPGTTWKRSADAGWCGLEVPELLDGAGVTFAETAVVLEELGRAATAGPFLGTAALGVPALLAVEPSPARDDLLRRVAVGAARTAVVLAPHGDSATAEAAFVLDDRGRLRGRADYVVDAPDADQLLVLADGGDRGPVLVGLPPAEVTVTPVPVLDATRSLGRVEAHGAPLPGDHVWAFVGDPAATCQRVLDRGAVALAVDSMGLAGAMLEATVDYVGVRHQFDRPIGSFQAVKHQCADALVSLRVGRQLLDEAVAVVASGAPDLGTVAARAKAFLGEAGVDVVGVAMQLHGGIGYTWESGIHAYLKRAVLDRALLGSPAVHRRRIAAGLPSPPPDE